MAKVFISDARVAPDRPETRPGDVITTSLYIVRRIDEEVLSAIHQPRTIVTIQGPSQSGKTSLMMRLCSNLRSKDPHLRTVYIDIQSFPNQELQSVSTVWQSIANSMAEQLKLANWDITDWYPDRPYDRQLGQFLDNDVFDQDIKMLIICLDGVDKIVGSSIKNEFFSSLRGFYQRGTLNTSWEKVNWLLSTTYDPSLFISVSNSSPFNIGHRANLHPFTSAEVLEFANRLGLQLDDQTLVRIIEYLGGHPYLVHLFLYQWSNDPSVRDQIFDAPSAGGGIFRDHLHRYLLIFQQDVALAAGMRSVIKGWAINDYWVINRLISAGLVRRRSDGQIEPSCSLYHDFFSRELIGDSEFDTAIETTRTFLKRAGVTIMPSDSQHLAFKNGPITLRDFEPVRVSVTAGITSSQDIANLTDPALRETVNQSTQAGLLMYQAPPDAVIRGDIAQARLKNDFIVIPISLAEVEQALRKDTCRAVLHDYADRYHPGANLFDERNSITDTAMFFGRSVMLNTLHQELKEPQGIGLFGLRKSGKTSILRQLNYVLRQQPVIHIDLQPYGGQADYASRLFNEFLNQLFSYLSDRTISKNRLSPDTSAAEGATDFIQLFIDITQILQDQDYHLPIVCFLDEIERILPMPTDSRTKVETFNVVFGTFRALCQDKRILSLLVADVHPDCNRINQWEQDGVATNPVNNFFKEFFVEPFSSDHTTMMLRDIGRLMGRIFDTESLDAIHQASGGHPFVSRQIASLLHQKIDREPDGLIDWARAKRYVERSFRYSGTIKDYFDTSIWQDLEKRGFHAAMAILNVLACTEKPSDWVTEEALIARLLPQHREANILEAILWLEQVGLVDHQETETDESYRMRAGLLTRWRQMQITAIERQQWSFG